MLDSAARRMSAYGSLLDEIEVELNRANGLDGQGKFIRDRVKHLRAFHRKALKVWNNPILQRLLK